MGASFYRHLGLETRRRPADLYHLYVEPFEHIAFHRNDRQVRTSDVAETCRVFVV